MSSGCDDCQIGDIIAMSSRTLVTTCARDCNPKAGRRGSDPTCRPVCVIPLETDTLQPVMPQPLFNGTTQTVQSIDEYWVDTYTSAITINDRAVAVATCDAGLDLSDSRSSSLATGFFVCSLTDSGTIGRCSDEILDPRMPTCGSSITLDPNNEFVAIGFADLNSVLVWRLNGTSAPKFHSRITGKSSEFFGFGSTVAFEIIEGHVLLLVSSSGSSLLPKYGSIVFYYIDRSTDTFERQLGRIPSIQFDTKYMYGYKAEINNGTLFVASTANTEGTRLWEVDVIDACKNGSHFFQTACALCPAGQYSAGRDFSPCLLCPEGTANPNQGGSSARSCLKTLCRGETPICPVGSPHALRDHFERETYAILDPDRHGSAALHFESTFFYSTTPVIAFVLILLVVVTGVLSIPRIKNHRKVRVCLRQYTRFNLIDDKRHDIMSTAFSIWLVVSIAMFIYFAVSFQASNLNDSVSTELRTADEVEDWSGKTNMTNIDIPPFSVSLALIGYNGPCNTSIFEYSIKGCMSADFNECVPDDFTAKSGTMEGSPTCNVTLKFPEGSKFDFVANISILSTFDHLYAQEAWFKVSTLNTLANGDNLIKGNSYLSGIIRPERDHILRGETTVEILSTMIAAIKCQFTISTEDLLLRFSNEICKFDPLNSVKAFSVISNSTSLVQPQEFYVPKDSSHEHYRFTLMFNKGHYYKLKKFSRYVTDIQVWVLILLFIFGFLWSFYAAIKSFVAFILRIVRLIIKKTRKSRRTVALLDNQADQFNYDSDLDNEGTRMMTISNPPNGKVRDGNSHMVNRTPSTSSMESLADLDPFSMSNSTEQLHKRPKSNL
jgi:hypothetical protein